ncbi:sulfite exporter TauE/SafE family protein [Planctomycetota bacterium]|nr:sulfite exporter TauE/SafE family protein [Planctomycetota bacterium]
MSTLDVADIIWIAFVLFFGSLSQGAVGFGVGLICIPLLVLGGISLPSAIAIMLITMFFANGASCWFYRKHIDWKVITPVLSLHLLALPIGIVTLYFLTEFNPDIAKAIVGVVVLGTVGSQLLLKVKRRDHLHPMWGAAAGLSSGYIEGLVGMGSPPLILYVMAHNWNVHRLRTFIWVIFLIDILPMFLMLWYTFGHEVVYATMIGILFFPITFIGARIGNILGHALGTERLRVVAYVILIILGVVSVCLPFLD